MASDSVAKTCDSVTKIVIPLLLVVRRQWYFHGKTQFIHYSVPKSILYFQVLLNAIETFREN